MDGPSPQQRRAPAADWLQPPVEEFGLTRYIQTLRERAWIVIAAVVITTGIALVYVVTANKVYKAEADMLVTPISTSDTSLVGLPGLIPSSSDPTRDVETASALITNTEVATRVKRALGSSESPRELLGKVEAAPVASSNIVAVTASEGSGTQARDLANAFATQAVANQAKKLHDAIDQRLPALEARLRQGVGDPVAIRAALASLETLRTASDPSLSVETKADVPSSPSSPRPALSIAGGLLAGLVLGIGGAFASQALDQRLRREEQLRRSIGFRSSPAFLGNLDPGPIGRWARSRSHPRPRRPTGRCGGRWLYRAERRAPDRTRSSLLDPLPPKGRPRRRSTCPHRWPRLATT